METLPYSIVLFLVRAFCIFDVVRDVFLFEEDIVNVYISGSELVMSVLLVNDLVDYDS